MGANFGGGGLETTLETVLGALLSDPSPASATLVEIAAPSTRKAATLETTKIRVADFSNCCLFMALLLLTARLPIDTRLNTIARQCDDSLQEFIRVV